MRPPPSPPKGGTTYEEAFHNVTPCFQIVISRNPFTSFRDWRRPLATSRITLISSAAISSGSAPGSSSCPASKSIQPGLRSASAWFDAISAPPNLASSVIAPQLLRLRLQHPGIRIKLIGEKRRASLGRREADVALRLMRPVEAGLFVRKLGSFGFSLYGAPDYLEKTPPHALAFIGYDASMADSPQELWLRTVVGNREVVLRTNDLETQVAAARAGLGVAALPQSKLAAWATPMPSSITASASITRVIESSVVAAMLSC